MQWIFYAKSIGSFQLLLISFLPFLFFGIFVSFASAHRSPRITVVDLLQITKQKALQYKKELYAKAQAHNPVAVAGDVYCNRQHWINWNCYACKSVEFVNQRNASQLFSFFSCKLFLRAITYSFIQQQVAA